MTMNLRQSIKSAVSAWLSVSARRTHVTRRHVIRCDIDLLEVFLVTEPAAPRTKLQLVTQPEVWSKGDGEARIERSEFTYRLTLITEGVEFELAHYGAHERRQARREFNRHRDRIVAECTGLYPSALQPSALRRWTRRLAPWFGGAALMVVFALIVNPPPKGQGAAGAAVAVDGPLSAASIDASAPEAWKQLPQEYRDVLLKAAQSAAATALAEQQGRPGTPQGLMGQITPQAVAAAPVRLTTEQLGKVKGATQLRRGQGGKVLYAFEDPMCSACQHFAAQAKAIEKNVSVVVLPVGFLAGAREQAAKALCAKDPLAAWSVAMRAQLVEGTACDEGFKKVDANNQLFLSLGFTNTPTLVSVSGAVVRGSGESTAIAQWVADNSD
jgi:hypothetical protein